MEELKPELQSDHLEGLKHDHVMRIALITMVAFNLVVIIALISLLYYSTRPSEFQPFEFPEQTVLNRLPGHGDTPAILIGQSVVVRAKKCNTSNQTFGVHGVKVWSSVSPPGNAISSGPLAGFPMKPGCVTKTFVNTVPVPVTEQMRALLKNRPYVVWQIRGTDTAEHEHGASRSWQTEPFYVYPKP
jgi:hypothetical protein